VNVTSKRRISNALLNRSTNHIRVVVGEVGANETKGRACPLASITSVGDSCKELSGLLLALPIFAKARASVNSSCTPVEYRPLGAKKDVRIRLSPMVEIMSKSCKHFVGVRFPLLLGCTLLENVTNVGN